MSLVGELRLPASLGCVPGPGQCMGPGRDPRVGGSDRDSLQGLGQHVPLSGNAEKWAGSGLSSPERRALFNRAESNHVASHNPRVTHGRASASTAPVACQSWPFGSSGHGQPVPQQQAEPCRGWCWTWCSASAGCSPGIVPLTRSKERKAEWERGCCSLLTGQYCMSSSWQGGIGQTPCWEGGTWLLSCWRGSFGQEELRWVGVAEQRSAE